MGLLSGKSVALVHEWYGATGGSESVFTAIHRLLPHARAFVLWRDRDARSEFPLRESWLARTPVRHSKALSLALMPVAWRTLTRQHFDVVVSSSHAFAHTVRIGRSAGTRYLSYVHSPARYLWSPDLDARGSSRLLALPRTALRAADVRLSRHVHSYAANSREVQARIRRFWQRDAYVINPPVDVAFFAAPPASVGSQSRSYLLGVGRWIPYKRFDVMIQVAEHAGLPLVIAGSGPLETALRRAASVVRVPVTFEHQPSRDRLRELYWGARALLFPTHEDFGIVPVEAQACGTPVLGLRRGGLLETVVDGGTGFLLESSDPAKYAGMVRHLDELDGHRISAHARAFSADAFHQKVTAWIAAEVG